MKQVSGLLNQIVRMFTYGDEDDGAGGSYPVEIPYWQTSAEVKQLRSSRALEANQERLKPSLTFKVRYRDDKYITPGMSINWRGENFTIINAEPDYIYKEYLIITAQSDTLPGK